MTHIKAETVKMLRERTGVGMMDCKRALAATNGDIEQATDWLRKQGIASAAKKSSRIVAEGVVSAAIHDGTGVILEINSETDFVSQNEQFLSFVNTITRVALHSDGMLDGLMTAKLDSGISVSDELITQIATIGENLNIRRLSMLKASEGQGLYSYVHGAFGGNAGKIGVLVLLEGQTSHMDAVGKQIAMHIAALKPISLSPGDLDRDLLHKEEQLQRELATKVAKSENMIDKILEGKMMKFYQDVCLLEQAFIMDTNKRVAQVAKEHGVEIKSYSYFVLGEGIEKPKVDFAKEVAMAAEK